MKRFCLGLLVLFSSTSPAARSVRTAPLTWQSWLHWTSWPGPVGVASQSTYYRSFTVSLTNLSSAQQTGKIVFIIGPETTHLGAGASAAMGKNYRDDGHMFHRFINPANWFDYSAPWNPTLLSASGGSDFSSAATTRNFSLNQSQSYFSTFSIHLTQPSNSWGATNDIGAVSIRVDIDQDRGALAGSVSTRAMVGGGPVLYHNPPNPAAAGATYGDWRGEITSAAYTPSIVPLNGGRPF